MEKETAKFGDVTLEQLAEAHNIVSSVLRFAAENMLSPDKEKREAARTGFALLIMNEVLEKPIRDMVAKVIREDIEREQRAEKEAAAAQEKEQPSES